LRGGPLSELVQVLTVAAPGRFEGGQHRQGRGEQLRQRHLRGKDAFVVSEVVVSEAIAF